MELVWVGVATLLLLMTASNVYHLRWARRLPSCDSSVADHEPPQLCSVIIAARDEAKRIERTIHSLLRLTGAALEVVVVDDRSTDGTTEIVRKAGAADSRVRLIRVDELPPDWLGKCHACHVGATAAQ